MRARRDTDLKVQSRVLGYVSRMSGGAPDDARCLFCLGGGDAAGLPAPVGVRVPGLFRVDARDVPRPVGRGRARAAGAGAETHTLDLLLDVQAAIHGPSAAATRDRAVGKARAQGGDSKEAPPGEERVRRGDR